MELGRTLVQLSSHWKQLICVPLCRNYYSSKDEIDYSHLDNPHLVTSEILGASPQMGEISLLRGLLLVTSPTPMSSAADRPRLIGYTRLRRCEFTD